jgi:amino acid permease
MVCSTILCAISSLITFTIWCAISTSHRWFRATDKRVAKEVGRATTLDTMIYNTARGTCATDGTFVTRIWNNRTQN